MQYFHAWIPLSNIGNTFQVMLRNRSAEELKKKENKGDERYPKSQL